MSVPTGTTHEGTAPSHQFCRLGPPRPRHLRPRPSHKPPGPNDHESQRVAERRYKRPSAPRHTQSAKPHAQAPHHRRSMPSPSAAATASTSHAHRDLGRHSNPQPSPAAGATRPTIRNDPTFPSGIGQSLVARTASLLPIHHRAPLDRHHPSNRTHCPAIEVHVRILGRLHSRTAPNCRLSRGVFSRRVPDPHVTIRRMSLGGPSRAKWPH